MNVLVLRNRLGPAALWILPAGGSEDAPEPALLPVTPQDPRIQNMASKGSGQSWQEWARYLASQPLLGSWRIQELPDSTDADEALAIVRRQDVLANAFRRTEPNYSA